MKKIWLLWVALGIGVFALLWTTVWPVKNPEWEQPTMGTMAHIAISGSISKRNLKKLHAEIDTTLMNVNHTLSTWQSDSEISMFNRYGGMEGFPVSTDFAVVTRAALKYSEITDGAFDPTVKPLVDYFGFGPEEQQNKPLAEIRKAVGWKKLHLTNITLRKSNPAVQLDLAAIAKGYGVDRTAEAITRFCTDFLVEIGGEIVAGGVNPNGAPWRVGIESPIPETAFGESVFQTLELSDRAMATSGDYRNFQVREDGTRYSHIIDPKTGAPAESDIAAVSVLADRCMDADAVATALFVMGSEKGFQWLETHPEFEAFFILHGDDENGFASRATPGFPNAGN